MTKPTACIYLLRYPNPRSGKRLKYIRTGEEHDLKGIYIENRRMQVVFFPFTSLYIPRVLDSHDNTKIKG